MNDKEKAERLKTAVCYMHGTGIEPNVIREFEYRIKKLEKVF